MQWWVGAAIGFLVCGPVTCIWAGLKGYELALQSRQFASQKEYDDVMNAWNKWGIILVFVWLGLIILGVILSVVMGVIGGAGAALSNQ